MNDIKMLVSFPYFHRHCDRHCLKLDKMIVELETVGYDSCSILEEEEENVVFKQ
jgi:hypothetical protein